MVRYRTRFPPARLLALALVVLSSAGPLAARGDSAAPRDGEETETAAGADEAAWEPLFLGYETEPGMDFGGRTVASLQSGISRAVDQAVEKPAVAPAWEFPLAAFLLLVQHEVGGHGGRAREFGLSPDYGFGFDFSAYTTTERDPRTNEELALLAAGGMEADQLLAQRVLRDLLRPEGADAAKVPLALLTKLDFTLYVSQTSEPEPGSGEDDFAQQVADGNDVAIYLTARQAQRLGAPAGDVWNDRYAIDFSERLLGSSYDDVRAAALWNLLDPMLVSAAWAYFRDHVLRGEARIAARGWRVGEGVTLAVGTRAALGPQAVSRFLDVHAATRRGTWTVTLRDLDSSRDRTWGAGAALRGFPLGRRLALGMEADRWEEPDAAEGFYAGSGWHAAAELDARLGSRLGAAVKVGTKSAGFLPGRPIADGVYVGFGLLGSL